MSEVTTAGSTSDPLRVALARWPILLLAALLGLGAGIGAASRHDVRVTAEARLAVGSNSLKAYQVGGYAVASQQLAANYARFVSDSSTTQQVLTDELGEQVQALTAVTASPIPDSNVVRVEATATDPQIAVEAAQTIAQELVDETHAEPKPGPGELLAKYRKLSAQMAKLQQALDAGLSAKEPSAARAYIATLTLRRAAVATAYQQSITGSGSVETKLTVIQDATVSRDDKTRTYQLYGIAGFLVGLVVGVAVANLLGPPRHPSSPLRFRRRRPFGRGSDASVL